MRYVLIVLVTGLLAGLLGAWILAIKSETDKRHEPSDSIEIPPCERYGGRHCCPNQVTDGYSCPSQPPTATSPTTPPPRPDPTPLPVDNSPRYDRHTPCPDATDTARGHFTQARELAEAGDYEAAITDFTISICLDPQYSTAYNDRGMSYFLLGQYERAIQDYDEAIRLDLKSFVAYTIRGVAFAHLGQYERAIQDYDEAIRIGWAERFILDPEYAKAYYLRGFAYHNLSQYERAIEDFTETIRLDPKNADAYAMRGLAYHELGQYQRASQDVDEAVRLDPSLEWRELMRVFRP